MYYATLKDKEKAEAIVAIASFQGPTEGIISKWFQHLPDKKAQAELAATIRNSTHLLDILKGILVREYDELLKERPQDYDNPNWALKQADKTGYKKAIQNFMTLLTITK